MHVKGTRPRHRRAAESERVKLITRTELLWMEWSGKVILDELFCIILLCCVCVQYSNIVRRCCLKSTIYVHINNDKEEVVLFICAIYQRASECEFILFSFAFSICYAQLLRREQLFMRAFHRLLHYTRSRCECGLYFKFSIVSNKMRDGFHLYYTIIYCDLMN